MLRIDIGVRYSLVLDILQMLLAFHVAIHKRHVLRCMGSCKLIRVQHIQAGFIARRLSKSHDRYGIEVTWSIGHWSHMIRQYVHSKGRVKTYNPSANQRRAISNVGMESSFLAIRQDGEPIVHTQGTGVVLVYVWRWSSHIEISGKRPIRSGLGIVV